jgi:hypothetical protein
VRELFPRCYLVDGDNHRRAHVRDDYVLEVRTLGALSCGPSTLLIRRPPRVGIGRQDV